MLPVKLGTVSTPEALNATRQAKLSMLVKEEWCYNFPSPRSQKLYINTH